MSENTTAEKGTLASYVTGFIFSVYLTIIAYLAVYNDAFNSFRTTAFIIVLAVVQFVVQIVFFLHIGKERKPRWKFAALIFMIVVLLILVLGSLWIMSNLNYRMSPEQMNNYMTHQQGL
jgi:cytochrome o ubiquinol oxidase operon protein cyoD